MRRESDMQVLIPIDMDVRECLWEIREQMISGSNRTDEGVQPPNPHMHSAESHVPRSLMRCATAWGASMSC